MGMVWWPRCWQYICTVHAISQYKFSLILCFALHAKRCELTPLVGLSLLVVDGKEKMSGIEEVGGWGRSRQGIYW